MLRQYDMDAFHILDPRPKANWGFAHPLTGQLLCPARLIFDDEEWVYHYILLQYSSATSRLCQLLKLGEYNLQLTDWPTFSYWDYNYDPEDELQGCYKVNFLFR